MPFRKRTKQEGLNDKVVRISNRNYERIISRAKYGDTFNSVLTEILDSLSKKKKI